MDKIKLTKIIENSGNGCDKDGNFKSVKSYVIYNIYISPRNSRRPERKTGNIS